MYKWLAWLTRLDQDNAAVLAKLAVIEAAITTGFLDMSGTTNQLDADIAVVQTNEAALVTGVNAIVTFLGTLPTLIANAVATAQANGATPAQLAEVTAVGTTIATETANLAAALATAQAATTPTVLGGTSTVPGAA